MGSREQHAPLILTHELRYLRDDPSGNETGQARIPSFSNRSGTGSGNIHPTDSPECVQTICNTKDQHQLTEQHMTQHDKQNQHNEQSPSKHETGGKSGQGKQGQGMGKDSPSHEKPSTGSSTSSKSSSGKDSTR
jgi:hypothetical protein